MSSSKKTAPGPASTDPSAKVAPSAKAAIAATTDATANKAIKCTIPAFKKKVKVSKRKFNLGNGSTRLDNYRAQAEEGIKALEPDYASFFGKLDKDFDTFLNDRSENVFPVDVCGIPCGNRAAALDFIQHLRMVLGYDFAIDRCNRSDLGSKYDKWRLQFKHHPSRVHSSCPGSTPDGDDFVGMQTDAGVYGDSDSNSNSDGE
jgi:hypothetical protein